jgi:hypothetical protein
VGSNPTSSASATSTFGKVHHRWSALGPLPLHERGRPGLFQAGNLTDDPELRHTEAGIAGAMFRVAVSGRREQEASAAPAPPSRC